MGPRWRAVERRSVGDGDGRVAHGVGKGVAEGVESAFWWRRREVGGGEGWGYFDGFLELRRWVVVVVVEFGGLQEIMGGGESV